MAGFSACLTCTEIVSHWISNAAAECRRGNCIRIMVVDHVRFSRTVTYWAINCSFIAQHAMAHRLCVYCL